MGKVILVPPPSNKQYLKANPSFGNTNSGVFMNFPVMFTPNYDGNSGLNATVSIPMPVTEVECYDPMQAYMRFYNFTSKRERGCGYMIHHVYDIEKTFWGHGEIEEIATSMYGDLLVQIDEGNGGNNSWNFMACDYKDYKIVAEFPSRKKSHRFEISKLLRKEIQVWISENVKDDYDFYENAGWLATNDEYFIKDDVEAIHFKMKWFGAEPDSEIEDFS
jgi:hypothetical protein